MSSNTQAQWLLAFILTKPRQINVVETDDEVMSAEDHSSRGYPVLALPLLANFDLPKC